MHLVKLALCSHNSRARLADLVAEHLDQLHYLNDILGLRIDALNEVLTDHLLNRLFIPLYINSIRQLPEPEVSTEVSQIDRNSRSFVHSGCLFIHSFIPDIYIVPLQETYSEALSVQLWPNRNVVRSLQKEDTLFWGSK